MKEQIIKLARETFPLYHNKLPEYEQIFKDFADEIEKLYQQTYLNDCIEKATPNLSKIKDVDKELAEIRGEDKTCRNCRNKVLSPISKPCSYCLGFDEWEPIK